MTKRGSWGKLGSASCTKMRLSIYMYDDIYTLLYRERESGVWYPYIYKCVQKIVGWEESKVVCWGFWGTVDVKFRVWVMMMKMVGCLGYVEGEWERKGVVVFIYRQLKEMDVWLCKFAFTVWKLFQTLLFLLLPTLAPRIRDRWCRTATIILTVYFSVVVAHILLWIKQQYNILPSYDSFNKQLLWKTWCIN